MKIACRCAKCGHIFLQGEDDLCLEFDFKDKKVTFVCRNKKCRNTNIFDFSGWQSFQKHSPLPPTVTTRF